MRLIFLSLFSILSVCAGSISAQTADDSLAIVNTRWQTTVTPDGIVHKRAQFQTLYQGCQHINLIEIPRKRKFRFGIGSPGGMKPTSGIAKDNEAIAALNGSYYNMKNGSSVCFLKIGAEVIDSTTTNAPHGALARLSFGHHHQRHPPFPPWAGADRRGRP